MACFGMCSSKSRQVKDHPLGVSVQALIDVRARFPAVTEDDTTSDVCHREIKPATTPDGWECRPKVTDAAKGWYSHSYKETATQAVQDEPPPGTKSYLSVLQSEPATRGQVGPANAFVSHAWQFNFLTVVAALEAFVAQHQAGEELFFWFDCLVIDEHANNDKPQEWWSTSFKDSISAIGRTVMVLAPWNQPVPLTRAWCLWELFCAVNTGCPFNVALSPEQSAALEEAVMKGSSASGNPFRDALAGGHRCCPGAGRQGVGQGEDHGRSAGQ